MKKIFIFFFALVLAFTAFYPASAQTETEETDVETQSDDDQLYYDNLNQCFALLDLYKDDLDSFSSGKISTLTQKWKDTRNNLRWNSAVSCGYIMSIMEPEELKDYKSELVYGAYYQLVAIELYILSINNNNDPTLYSLYQQMAEAAQNNYSIIPK
ncbi:MAG TPA: hypothetical protein PKV59_07295 [Flexilinea sp.]|nr:hypothetical protein [Flexilinea sp.]